MAASKRVLAASAAFVTAIRLTSSTLTVRETRLAMREERVATSAMSELLTNEVKVLRRRYRVACFVKRVDVSYEHVLPA